MCPYPEGMHEPINYTGEYQIPVTTHLSRLTRKAGFKSLYCPHTQMCRINNKQHVSECVDTQVRNTMG